MGKRKSAKMLDAIHRDTRLFALEMSEISSNLMSQTHFKKQNHGNYRINVLKKKIMNFFYEMIKKNIRTNKNFQINFP